MRTPRRAAVATRQSVIPQPLSLASARAVRLERGVGEEVPSRTGSRPGERHAARLRVDPDPRLRAVRPGSDRSRSRPGRPLRLKNSFWFTVSRSVRPVHRNAAWSPVGERAVDPVAVGRADALEQRAPRELLESVLAPPDRPDREDPEAEDEQRQDERVAPRDEEERRGEAGRERRVRRAGSSRGRCGPAATRRAAASACR